MRTALPTARPARRRAALPTVVLALSALGLAGCSAASGAASSGTRDASPASTAASAGATTARPLPPMPVTTSTLSQNLSIDLPGWTAYAHRGGWAADVIKYSQTEECAGTCPADADRSFILITPPFFYRPQDHIHVVAHPTYQQYAAGWAQLQAAGMGTIRDRTTAVVDGRPAVLMTVEFANEAAGLAACETGITAPADCWNTFSNRTARVAIVDAPNGPVLFYAASNTDGPHKDGLVAELDAALRTVRFG